VNRRSGRSLERMNERMNWERINLERLHLESVCNVGLNYGSNHGQWLPTSRPSTSKCPDHSKQAPEGQAKSGVTASRWPLSITENTLVFASYPFICNYLQ
jgi:hypothetical protein